MTISKKGFLVNTDEAYFHLSGYVNSQNTRMWISENPQFFIESSFYPQKVGVCGANRQRRIIGPIVLIVTSFWMF